MISALAQTPRAGELLLGALRDPRTAESLGPSEWDVLLRLARRSRLLGRLATDMHDAGLADRLPTKVVEHFTAAQIVAGERQRMARWEVNRILRALTETPQPITLLKGCAYILAELPPMRGRLPADVDLMVPMSSLSSVERALVKHGWQPAKLTEYDQRYYRAWMHELPPLRHPERGMEVDLHHNIVPRTSRLRLDAQKLLAASTWLDGSCLRVLQPPDMVLHSAVHLFHDGEFINGLRDLLDLSDLLNYFDKQPGFWEGLLLRSRELGLRRPLFYTLRYTQKFMGTAIPRHVIRASRTGAPPWLILRTMDALMTCVFVLDHPDRPRRGTQIARWLLYVRSHWLRMPPWLLAKHLLRKQRQRLKARRKTGSEVASGSQAQ